MFLNTSHMFGFNAKQMNVFLNVPLQGVTHNTLCQYPGENRSSIFSRKENMGASSYCVPVCIYKCIHMYLYIHTQIL